mgnify:CR=1 FL=1
MDIIFSKYKLKIMQLHYFQFVLFSEFDVVNTCDDYTRTNKIINDNIPVDFYDGDATAKTTDDCAFCTNDSNTYLPLTIGNFFQKLTLFEPINVMTT